MGKFVNGLIVAVITSMMIITQIIMVPIVMTAIAAIMMVIRA